MFKRQRTGSVICTSCGVLVGVGDERCYNCNRWNPGLWGWAPAFRALGQDLGFVPFVIGTCIVVYALMLLFSRGSIETNNMFALFSPNGPYDNVFLANYANINLNDEFTRVKGIASVTVFGAGQ